MNKKILILYAMFLTGIFTMNAQTCSLYPAGSTIYVDSSIAVSGDGTSWGSAFQTLGEALATAHACQNIDRVNVAKGTYIPTRNPFTMNTAKVGVEVLTNSSGNNLPNQKSFHIRCGLQVYGGYPSGGGVRNLITNTTVLNGQINPTHKAFHLVIMDTSSNWASANDTTLIDGFKLQNAGLNTNLDGMTINNFYFQDRMGGAIFCRGGLNKITNCFFTGNSSLYGGAIAMYNTKALVVNNVFKSNTGGSLCFFRGDNINLPTQNSLVNNTFVNNSASNVISAEQGVECNFFNNIMFSNGSGSRISLNSNTIFNASNCMLQAINLVGIYTNCTYGINPLLKGGSDFDSESLFGNSPAKDAGNNSFVPSDIATDIAGNTRFINTTVDLGAFEASLCVATYSSFSQTFCQGTSYTFNDIARTITGTYLDTLVNAVGCDSIVTLNLTFKSISTSSTNLTICSNELPYTWNGLTFTAAGTQTAHLTNSVGCDSAATLNLSVTPSTVISTANMTACGSYTWNGNTYTQSGTYISPLSGCDIHVLNLTITHELLLSAKVFLLGAFDSIAGKMHDSLRVKGLIPTMEPYSAAPFNKAVISELAGETVSSSVLAITGDNAIVDWVFVELRSASNPATIVATKRALVQRDGDIVSAVDGISPVPFFTMPNDDYYISIKHRNHLGIQTQNTIHMVSCITTVFDFTSSLNVYTIPSQPANSNYASQKLVGSTYLMWSGDARNNKNIKYNGLNNDKDFVLTSLGGAGFINSTLNQVYRSEDNNMDGKVRYNNTDNDRALILSNLGNQSNNIINQHTSN